MSSSSSSSSSSIIIISSSSSSSKYLELLNIIIIIIIFRAAEHAAQVFAEHASCNARAHLCAVLFCPRAHAHGRHTRHANAEGRYYDP